MDTKDGKNESVSDSNHILNSLLNRPPISFGNILNIDAGDNGDFENADFWESLDNEESDFIPPFAPEELDTTKEIAFQLFSRGTEKKGGRNQASADKAVTIADIDDDPYIQDLFFYIYGHFALIFEAKNEKEETLASALNWLFKKPTLVREDELGFEDALMGLDLNSRPMLLRMRMVYELWYVGWRMPPLNEEAVEMPNFLRDIFRAKYNKLVRKRAQPNWTSVDAQVIMEEVWNNIGINPIELFNKIVEYHPINIQEFKEALNFLIEERLISESSRRKKNLRRFNHDVSDFEDLNESRLYLTGENPILLAEEIYKDSKRRVTISYISCFQYIY